MAKRQHDLSEEGTRFCWCNPRVEQQCPACDGDGEPCWRCDGEGWVPFYDPTLPTVTIHNEETE